MTKLAAAISTLAVVGIGLHLTVVNVSNNIPKDKWWCAEENHFKYPEKTPKLVPYIDLLPEQQKIVTVWWQDELNSLWVRSEEFTNSLARMEIEAPERYAKIRNRLQPMDPSPSKLPDITMVQRMRFACTQKLTLFCRISGCETPAY